MKTVKSHQGTNLKRNSNNEFDRHFQNCFLNGQMWSKLQALNKIIRQLLQGNIIYIIIYTLLYPAIKNT